MKQKSLPFLLFALCMTVAITAWSQDYDNPASISANTVTVDHPGPVYGSPFDTYYINWYPTTAFPVTATTWYHHPSAVLDNFLYVQANAGLPTGVIVKYDIGTGNGGGVWTNSTSLPSSLVGGDMIACNGKLFYIGGDATGVTSAGTNTVYEYDPSTTAWSTKATMPAALTGHGAVNWGDSIIFVVGGPWTTTGNDRNVYYYRVATDTWGTISNSLPAGSSRRAFGIGLSENKIIIAGGYAGAFLKSAYVGTINSATSITWAAVADIPASSQYTGLSRMGGEAVGGYFFTVGGERGGPGGYHDTTYVFKFASNSWLPVYGYKPTAVSNVFNSISGKVFSNDTIKLFCPSGYVGAAPATNTNFEVMKFRASTGVGIEFIRDEKSVQVFPNPSQGNVTLQISQGVKPSVAEIYDVRGALLMSFSVHKGANPINLSTLSKGLYIVRVQTQSGIITEKLNLIP